MDYIMEQHWTSDVNNLSSALIQRIKFEKLNRNKSSIADLGYPTVLYICMDTPACVCSSS